MYGPALDAATASPVNQNPDGMLEVPGWRSIGAGPAGLATLKALADAGVPAVCFEPPATARRPVGVRRPALVRVPHAAPEHQPHPHRVRRLPDARATGPTTPATRRVAGYLADYARTFGL